MTREEIKAAALDGLDQSIAKWKRIAAGGPHEAGCVLCEMFTYHDHTLYENSLMPEILQTDMMIPTPRDGGGPSDCSVCPLFIHSRTHEDQCGDTPFYRYRAHAYRVENFDQIGFPNMTEAQRAPTLQEERTSALFHAQRMVEHLERVRREYEERPLHLIDEFFHPEPVENEDGE